MNRVELKRREIEFDILHSDCRDCALTGLECLHYIDGDCRRE